MHLDSHGITDFFLSSLFLQFIFAVIPNFTGLCNRHALQVSCEDCSTELAPELHHSVDLGQKSFHVPDFREPTLTFARMYTLRKAVEAYEIT